MAYIRSKWSQILRFQLAQQLMAIYGAIISSVSTLLQHQTWYLARFGLDLIYGWWDRTPKGPNHDQGFTGQSFVQTYTEKKVHALESCNGNTQLCQKPARETEARLDKMTRVKQSKPCLLAREQHCQNLKKCDKLLWEELFVSYPWILVTETATSIWDSSVSGKTPGAWVSVSGSGESQVEGI